jgi:outer membrane receptor protein involved in Fe transport
MAAFSWRSVVAVAGCVLALAGTASGQSVSSGTIHGTIRDQSGGVLPGVTATLSSPSLQVPQLVQVTDAEGQYRFVDLPAGTYLLKFELTGFSTLIREDLRLTVGFTARVDESMKVGAMEESVTVSGQSPIVDITSTSAAVAFTKEALEEIPRGRDLQNVLAMAPGVTQDTMDVGGSTLAQRQDTASYGVEAQPKLQYEGMNIAMGADQNTPIYFIDNSLEEVQVRTSGNDAEVSTPGVSMIAIMKSGGNTYHGSYRASYQPDRLQANNLNAELRRQNIGAPPELKKFYDVAGDLGGRIIRDRLWFYGGYAKQTKSEGTLGFAADPGPDGQYLTPDDTQAYFESSLYQYSLKMSYQPSRNNRLVYAWQRGVKAQPQNGGGRLRPLEATRDYKNPTAIQKAEWQSTVTPRLLLNAMGGYAGYVTDYDAGRSHARPDKPSRQELETGLFTGSHVQHQGKTRDRYQAEASASFFPGRSFAGQHDFKTGVSIYWDRTSDDWLDNVAGNYVLITDRGVPARIRAYNTPAAPKDNEDIYAWYLKDSWRATDKLTLNLGLRWEYQHSYLPEQDYAGARDFPTVFPAKHVDKLDVQTFNRVVPRVGVAYDIDGKSVVKATWGLYNYILGDTYGDVFAATATANAVFLWHDVNNDRLWTPNESNLSLGSGNPDFVSITAASNYELSPELKQPNTWETTASYERELAPSLAVRVMYINKIIEGNIETINAKRPYSAYNVPITRRDPGPDGVLGNSDDAGPVTMYDYAASFSGATFVSNKRVNADNTDRFNSVEFSLTKRASSRWMAQASYFAVKNHRWLTGNFQHPNDEFFPLDETWSWAGSVSGTYRFPYDVSVSGFLQSRSGVKGQRTYQFRAADPDGGPRIAQSNTITLRLEPYGTRQLSPFNILNFRANKDFRLTGGRRFSIDFDVFNLLNSATPTGAEFLSGPAFGYATGVTPPLITRIGARFTF